MTTDLATSVSAAPIRPGGRLFQRQALALIALFALTGLVFALSGWYLARSHVEVSSQQLNRDLAARIVEQNSLIYADGSMVDESAVKRTFDHYMNANPAIEIYQLDAGGEIVAYSADQSTVVRQKVDMEPIHALLDNNAPLPVMGDDPRGMDRHKVFSATPLVADKPELGYLYVILRGETVDAAVRAVGDSHLFRLLMIALACSLGAGLLGSLIVFRLLGRRLERLSQRIMTFTAAEDGSSQPQPQPLAVRNDELGTLENGFNLMTERIGDQMHLLAETDRRRRTFMAHISHDLRTPITVISSLLESLDLRYARLNDAERIEGVRAARGEVEHLSRLVNDLFHLARMQNAEVIGEREPLSLPDLIHDITEKYRTPLMESEHRIVANVSRDLPLVDGDTGLIERMLDNLIINARTHCGSAGEIIIDAEHAVHGVTIRVRDTGPGIPHDVGEKIFEPGFTRGNPDGGGLGLSIASGIAEWHGGAIAHVATEIGACFEVQLPASA